MEVPRCSSTKALNVVATLLLCVGAICFVLTNRTEPPIGLTERPSRAAASPLPSAPPVVAIVDAPARITAVTATAAAAPPAPLSTIRGAADWAALHTRSVPRCEALNEVPTRGDDFANNLAARRPWSAQSRSFPLRPSAKAPATTQRECRTAAELVAAVKYGQREWSTPRGRALQAAREAKCEGTASSRSCMVLLRQAVVPARARNVSNYNSNLGGSEANIQKYLRMQGMPSAAQSAAWVAAKCDAVLAPCFAADEALIDELSVFETQGCAVPFLSGQTLCTLLSKFRAVNFIGDSLTRHTIQALDVLLNADLERGAVLPASKCTCDGMFSEAGACRSEITVMQRGAVQTAAYRWQPRRCPDASVRFWDTRFQAQVSGFAREAVAQHCNRSVTAETMVKENVAHGMPPTLYAGNGDGRTAKEAQGTHKSVWDARPQMFVFGGGFHAWSNAAIFGSQVQSGLAALKPCAVTPGDGGKRGKTHVIMSFLTSQSRAMDTKWPYQSRERVVIENEKLLQKAMATGNSAGGSLNVVDFWNLTRNAQTSDGMHTLTAQNVAKASTIVALMEMALKSAA